MSALSIVPEPARALIFEALLETAWADGVITIEELAATRAAARALGVRDADLAENAPRAGIAVDGASLALIDREIVVAVACWIAVVDGNEAPVETATVRRVAEALEVPEPRRLELVDVARRVRGSGTRFLPLSKELDLLVAAVARAPRPPSGP